MDDMTVDIPFESDDEISDVETQFPEGIEEICPEDAEDLKEQCLSSEDFPEDEGEEDEDEVGEVVVQDEAEDEDDSDDD